MVPGNAKGNIPRDGKEGWKGYPYYPIGATTPSISGAANIPEVSHLAGIGAIRCRGGSAQNGIALILSPSVQMPSTDSVEFILTMRAQASVKPAEGDIYAASSAFRLYVRFGDATTGDGQQELLGPAITGGVASDHILRFTRPAGTAIEKMRVGVRMDASKLSPPDDFVLIHQVCLHPSDPNEAGGVGAAHPKHTWLPDNVVEIAVLPPDTLSFQDRLNRDNDNVNPAAVLGSSGLASNAPDDPASVPFATSPHRYDYFVQAENVGSPACTNASETSERLVVQTASRPTQLSAPPGGIRAVDGAATGSSLQVEWSTPTDTGGRPVKGYALHLRPGTLSGPSGSNNAFQCPAGGAWIAIDMAMLRQFSDEMVSFETVRGGGEGTWDDDARAADPAFASATPGFVLRSKGNGQARSFRTRACHLAVHV